MASGYSKGNQLSWPSQLSITLLVGGKLKSDSIVIWLQTWYALEASKTQAIFSNESLKMKILAYCLVKLVTSRRLCEHVVLDLRFPSFTKLTNETVGNDCSVVVGCGIKKNWVKLGFTAVSESQYCLFSFCL